MATGRADVFVPEGEDPRDEPPLVGGETELLTGFLRWMRQTLELKCSGLNAEQLARRAVEPSTMSLLGLIRHMAEVERSWFQRRLAGVDSPPIYYSEDDPDGDFDGAIAQDACVAEAFATWKAQIAFADEFVAQAPNLDVVGIEEWRGEVSLRWVLIHMVEEYSRHLGHADLLRERIDGRLGQ